MIEIIPQNHFEVNSYVLFDETKECVLVDVCSQGALQEREIINFIEQHSLKVKHILLTHPHVDHLCGSAFACKQFSLPITMSIDAVKMFQTAESQASMMGFELGDIENVEIKTIMPGDVIEFGNSKIECLDTAGHCVGSLSYYNAKEKYIITGDALFAQSIGRTDLPTGDLDQLLSNIKEKILTLPEETKVYPGHGPYSTIDYEKTHNPFLL